MTPLWLFVVMAAAPVRAGDRPWRDLKGVVHCHSRLSYDSPGTEEEIVAAANAARLDFVVMTDHYTDEAVREAPRGVHGRTLFIPGAEMILPEGGSLLALGLETPLSTQTATGDLIAAVHAQGALAFLGHLELARSALDEPFDGLEIFNIHAAFDQAGHAVTAVRALATSTENVLASLLKPRPGNMAAWDRLNAFRPRPIVAGTDAHDNVKVLGRSLAGYDDLFGALSTHVWAAAPTREGILDALRSGRSYVCFDLVGDCSGFLVEAVDGRWRLTLPAEGHIVLRRAGVVVAEGRGRAFEAAAEAGAVYRVDVDRGGRPWIVAGPFLR